jgi:BirA family biotin operon repressor/biotin-[acetyl-CoA-carboxylase] ligase
MIYFVSRNCLDISLSCCIRRFVHLCGGEYRVKKHRLESYLSKGRNGSLIFLDTVASTNTLATQLARRGTADGTAVIANCQTKGSGRLGRSFYSPGDIGVYFSYVKVLPEDGACSVGLLTSLAALAVCEAIDSVCHFEPRVKWPNDILVGGKRSAAFLPT